jgi:hypothetical protein
MATAIVRMTSKYNDRQLESFVTGIRHVSESMKDVLAETKKRIGRKNRVDFPTYVVNIHGSLPLFDILNIVDPGVDVDRAVYFPGSSRIKNSGGVLRNCFENFLWNRQDETDEVNPLFSIDEVVGGHSVERAVNAYNAAVRRVAKQNLKDIERRKGDIEEAAYELRTQFPLTIFGIKDTRDLKRRMNKRYGQLRSGRNRDKIIYEFPVKKIITMDDPDFETIRFKRPTSSGHASGQGFYPKVEEIVFPRAYTDLLHDVAMSIGEDPKMIDPSRARVRTDCETYSKKPKYE